MINHCRNFKHGFPYIEARISDLQARNISPWTPQTYTRQLATDDGRASSDAISHIRPLIAQRVHLRSASARWRH